MRIGVDARELCGRATGVGRYLSGLLDEWSGDPRARRHEFVLYAHEAPAISLDTRHFAIRIVSGPPGTWWEQMRLPRVAADDHLDVWFAPAYTAPLRLGVPIVLAVHDLSFFAHPEWFRVREGMRRRWMTRQSVAAAERVITISEFSKRELVERLDVAEMKIDVIPPGVSISHQPSALSHSHARVLFVGSLFTRRHVPDLIRAFAPIARAHPDASLDIAGDNRTYPHEDPRHTAAAEGIDSQVRWHDYATEDQLRALYAHARVLAFLSEYEGLGLTPLEALAAGVPPVLLDTPIARESCGDAALYVPIGDRGGVTRALERLLFDPTARAQILGAAPAVLAKYQWPRAADATLRVIEQCSR
jgi:glycosyltransferase involved in cell wall biosynthesis